MSCTARNENVVDAGVSGGTRLWPKQLTYPCTRSSDVLVQNHRLDVAVC